MKIIPISGKAGHGKDTLAQFMRTDLEVRGKRVLVCHYGDLLKYICCAFFGWDGQKDDAGRTLLQNVGTEVIRVEDPDYWVKFINSILQFFPDEWDYVLIPDTRFPNEIEKLDPAGMHPVYHVRVVRDGYSTLSKAQQHHISETALDNYKNIWQYVENDGTLDDLCRKAIEIDDRLEKLPDSL